MDGDIAIEIEIQELPLYRSVEPRSIRVLDLEASTEYNDPLVGSLRTISLDDEGSSFTALSYTWGDPTAKRTLWLNKNGVSLEITTSCFRALRQLRHNYGAITIWVDAICINQADDREKEIQLPLMGEIYMWAEVVYVWLGTETKASLQALEALSGAASFNYLPIDPDRTSRSLPTWSEKARLALKLLPPYLNYGMIRKLIFNVRLTNAVEHQLVELLSRPWFSRAWTFQEIILASEAVVLCGPAAYRLDVLARGVEFFNEPDPIASFSSYERTVANGVRIPDRDMYHKTPYLGYSFPKEGEAFRRALQLWLSIDRPTTRNGRQVRKQLRSGQSFNDYQKPYANIHDSIIWNSVFGLYINSLVAHGLLIAPILVVVALVVKATDALTYVLISAAGAAFALIFMPLLPRRRPRKAYGSSKSKEDFVFEGLVQALRQRKAGVPKDRSYALYGILENLQLKLPQPDYRKSQGLVYYELFINLMRWRPAFVILLIDCGHGSEGRDVEMADAPTWVPDWNRLANDGAAMTESFLSMKRMINVIPGHPPYFRLDSNSRELVVRGQWIECQIAYCTDKFEVASLTPREAYDNIALLNGPLSNIVGWICKAKSIKAGGPHSSSDQHKNPVVSFWNRINGIGPGYDIPIKFFHEILTQRPLVSEQSENIERYQWSVFEAVNQALHEAQEYSPAVAFEAIMRVVRKDRRTLWYIVEAIFDLSCNEGRLFVTSDGTVGCAYKHIEVNDRLALVAGVPAPLILRPRKITSPPLLPGDDGYEVVASAFVPEWNEGKAMKKDQLEEIKLV
ncbi:heterokaryon incompatibility protein-domain-containing protein [Hypoxylon rubiginosum]|uniref:Heterokaryon incompatibility protein-domain-containing protein n=1 Tax=Hypoxylon rubiginosum TaxID=110542 RepID=A0ACC0D0P1_9PEZI|nr:heterokaryon incompatibility protein-domain-containing protein [Hypoxylon rubiginosum]